VNFNLWLTGFFGRWTSRAQWCT